jgi:integrase
MATIKKRHWMTKKGEKQAAFLVTWHDRSGNRHRRQFKTKGEADRVRIEMEGKVQTVRSAANRLTVEEAMKSYLARCEERSRAGERMSPHNLEVYRGHVFRHILHPVFGLGEIRLSQLSARAIDEWSNQLRDEGGVSVQTRKKILGTLRAALFADFRRPAC